MVRSRALRGVTVTAMVASMLGAAGPVHAQEAPAITLGVVQPSYRFGVPATASGAISPGASGETVSIWSTAGELLNQTQTDESGRYSAAAIPQSNGSLVARWEDAMSPEVAVFVEPDVRVEITDVRLFGRARIAGEVHPALPDGIAEITLMRNGSAWRRRTIALSDTDFSTRFDVNRPGRFRARVVTRDASHLRGHAQSWSSSIRLPYLTEGSHGDYVRVLERRLADLGYHLDGVDRNFDYRTADAVRAFNKVQGRARYGHVDAGTWRALASPIRPRPRARGPRFHIEVDQTRQVLYVVRRGKVRGILHVSTGAGYATRDGVFHVHSKLAGYSGRGLYYPSYFDGLRAIHGWPSVPTYNASHGCIRVPMWSAQWIYGLAPIGTEIRIYH